MRVRSWYCVEYKARIYLENIFKDLPSKAKDSYITLVECIFYNELDTVDTVAIEYLNKAIALAPEDTTAYFYRGAIKHQQKDLDGAIADYTKTIELDKEINGAYFRRGQAKHSQNDILGAIDDYTKGIQLDSLDTAAYYLRGVIRESQNDLDGAISDYTKTIELDSSRGIRSTRVNNLL